MRMKFRRYLAVTMLSGLVSQAWAQHRETMPARAEATSAVDLKPVLLVQEGMDGSRTGVTFAEALEHCERSKLLFRKRYYFVFCRFLGKNWEEIREETRFRTDNQFMGYSTNSGSSTRAVYGRVSGASAESRRSAAALGSRYGGRSRERESSRSGSSDVTSSTDSSSQYYSQEPVLVEVSVPYTHVYSVSQKVYGYEVLGMGDLSQPFPWSRLVTSLDLAPELPGELFASEREARIECERTRLLSSDRFAMYRTKCEVHPQGQKFYYEIVTQNPLL